MESVCFKGIEIRSLNSNVPRGGLEPPRIAPYAPQTYVSTNSTIWAMTSRGPRFAGPLDAAASVCWPCCSPEKGTSLYLAPISGAANYFFFSFTGFSIGFSDGTSTGAGSVGADSGDEVTGILSNTDRLALLRE